MEVRSLTTFIQVAESGSFSRAAEKLGYSQPTVSVQIKGLEEELGIRLFDRIGHTVRLTEQGRDVLAQAQKICHMCQELSQGTAPKSRTKSVIRLAMADSLASILLKKGFSAFRNAYPNISIRLTTAGTSTLLELLDHNEADIVCTLDSHTYDTNYVIASEEKIGVHFVVSSNNPLSRAKRLTKEDLLTQDFLLTEKGMSYRRLLDEWLAKDSLEIQPVLENGSADTLCQLVEDGIGMSFLPDYVTEGAVQRGTIVRLDVEGFAPELWKQLLYHRDKWLSLPMESVIEYLSGILLHHEE
ncbi:MAG: LysR family transcriptional regulator [Ruminiclostridium sp.]|nr:LysR family transcriptional regulator [Ruminiclostridium sp.]